MRLRAHHTKDKHDAPLVHVDWLPGDYAELYPAQLRRLAQLLNTIANDAEQGARGQIIYGAEVEV